MCVQSSNTFTCFIVVKCFMTIIRKLYKKNMSDYMSKVDNLKFQNKISVGDHSPKLQRRFTDNHDPCVTFSFNSSFFRELSIAKRVFAQLISSIHS